MEGRTAPSFCDGPRYYLDCNALRRLRVRWRGICSGACSGTGCGCAGGDCGNRTACCNLFRYGQCNQHVACVGPIVCRIVTCVPPWAFEPTCTTVTRVDEYTAHHDKPCLHTTVGSVDAVAPAGNETHVQGWALDFDTQAPVAVQAFVNGVLVAETAASLYRPDVAATHPGFGPDHGFDLVVPHPGPAHDICVVAAPSGWGEGGAYLGCHHVGQRLTGSPYGALDSVAAGRRALRVTGWVFDPDRSDATAVHVYIDGQMAGAALANAPRPDVAAAYPLAGPLHGFDFSVPSPAGRHDVCVYGINIGPPAPNTTIACRTVTVPDGRPFGHVDHAAGLPGLVHVVGWAVDPDSTGSVPVHVYSGSNFVGAGTASLSRPDVAAAYPGVGAAHGFDLLLPIGGGSHLLRTYAVDIAGADVSALIDERWVAVPTGPPIGVLDQVHALPGALRVVGWTIDPDTGGPIDVHVYVDDRFAGAGRADRDRPDIADDFVFYGAKHGFDLTVAAGAGPHVVRVYGINGGPPAGNTLIGTAMVVTS